MGREIHRGTRPRGTTRAEGPPESRKPETIYYPRRRSVISFTALKRSALRTLRTISATASGAFTREASRENFSSSSASVQGSAGMPCGSVTACFGASSALASLELDARAVMPGISSFHLRIDDDRDSTRELASRGLVDCIGCVHRRVGRIAHQRERGAVRNAELRAHRVLRGKRSFFPVRLASIRRHADRHLADLVQLQRPGAAQCDELLHGRLDPRAARIELHVHVLHRPVLAEIG